MKQIGKFNSKQTMVKVFDTELDVLGTHIYAIESTPLHDEFGQKLVRFGNAQQMKSILNTYWAGVMWCGDDRDELNQLLQLLSRAISGRKE